MAPQEIIDALKKMNEEIDKIIELQKSGSLGSEGLAREVGKLAKMKLDLLALSKFPSEPLHRQVTRLGIKRGRPLVKTGGDWSWGARVNSSSAFYQPQIDRIPVGPEFARIPDYAPTAMPP